MKLTFVETPVFSARWHKRLDDEALRSLQNALQQYPDWGDPIPGCGMIRKIRFGDDSRGKGKRSGIRVIYMHTAEASQIDLLTLYGKDQSADLSAGELRRWCQLARILREHARARVRREERLKEGKAT